MSALSTTGSDVAEPAFGTLLAFCDEMKMKEPRIPPLWSGRQRHQSTPSFGPYAAHPRLCFLSGIIQTGRDAGEAHG